MPADHLLGSVGRGFNVAVHVLTPGADLAAGCPVEQSALSRLDFHAEHAFSSGIRWRISRSPNARFRLASEISVGRDARLLALPSIAATLISPRAACAKVFASEMVWPR